MTVGATTTVFTEEIELVFVCDHCKVRSEVALTDFVALGQIFCGECEVPMDLSDVAKVVI